MIKKLLKSSKNDHTTVALFQKPMKITIKLSCVDPRCFEKYGSSEVAGIVSLVENQGTKPDPRMLKPNDNNLRYPTKNERH